MVGSNTHFTLKRKGMDVVQCVPSTFTYFFVSNLSPSCLFFSSDHDGANPAAGVRYGTITSGDATSDAFVIPGDGFTGSLTNSDFTGGTYPTNLAVVPEPSSTLLILQLQ